MKTYKYILFPIALILSSCYIYKPYSEKSLEDMAKQSDNSMIVAKSIRSENSANQANEKVRTQQGKLELSAEEREAQMIKEKEREQQKTQNQNPDTPVGKSNSSFSKSDGSTGAGTPKNANKGGGIEAEESQPKVGIKGKLEPNKYFKIYALGNQYKIQVDKWEGDTLVAHKIRKPSKQYKIHMNDIDEEAILERRFSKPFSDLLTVGAYASGAAIVLLLVL